eukprot:104112-Alexandrium_andersonii.AAC.1
MVVGGRQFVASTLGRGGKFFLAQLEDALGAKVNLDKSLLTTSDPPTYRAVTAVLGHRFVLKRALKTASLG